ncbi:hypothetical protein J2X69_003333 [Algoriphagus sp. 4150]|uniref:hypothetical protein n=1 Tax=Algoriphagus sp. 4150 TaxID=2817756 RepID=UPI00285FCDA1|nr:hypothetical protein [Algoriphagus sp. 4150]MDR7130974.1 hypothetical protein [Algoriphagus sp. 4150]
MIFYFRHEKWLGSSDDADNHKNRIETIRKIIYEDASEFILTYQLFGLKKEGNEESNFTSRYYIKLELNNSINFKLDKSHKTVLQKTYGSMLFDLLPSFPNRFTSRDRLSLEEKAIVRLYFSS